jgi:hypothetical protein
MREYGPQIDFDDPRVVDLHTVSWLSVMHRYMSLLEKFPWPPSAMRTLFPIPEGEI